MKTELIGQRPNFTALPNWLRGRTTPLELATLWALQSHFPSIHPSLNLLAQETGMSRRSVVNVLRTMETKGWLVRERVTSETGGLTANRYALTIWDAHWAVEADRAGNALVQEMHHPSAGDAPPLVHHVHPPSAPRAHKEEQFKKNKIRNLDKTPFCSPVEPESRRPAVSDTPLDLPKIAPSPQPVEKPVENLVLDTFLIGNSSFLEPQASESPLGAPVSVQKQPQQPIPPWGQPRPLETPSDAPVKKRASQAKTTVFCPNKDDIPAALLPASEKIIAFWQHKAGKKTPQAWELLIAELTKINDFVNGGLDAVSEQCDLGIKAKINGKGWMSITLNNFIKMGGGSQPKTRQRYGRQDVLEKAHEASQMVKILKERQKREEAEFFATLGGALPS
jgi:hypothetical protein